MLTPIGRSTVVTTWRFLFYSLQMQPLQLTNCRVIVAIILDFIYNINSSHCYNTSISCIDRRCPAVLKKEKDNKE